MKIESLNAAIASTRAALTIAKKNADAAEKALRKFTYGELDNDNGPGGKAFDHAEKTQIAYEAIEEALERLRDARDILA